VDATPIAAPVAKGSLNMRLPVSPLARTLRDMGFVVAAPIDALGTWRIFQGTADIPVEGIVEAIRLYTPSLRVAVGEVPIELDYRNE
jgi:hypothetical protein